ncbi:hypothetical protein D3C85_341160 [compost metagenome]
MDHAFDLAPLGVLAQGIFVVAAAQFDDIALGILDRLIGADHVAATQAGLATGDQTLEAGRRDFLEVAGINVDLAGEWQHAHAHVLLGMARQLEVFHLPFGVIGDHDFQRPQYAHGPRGGGIEVFANGEFEHADIHQAAGAVDADHVAEGADRTRGVAATTIAAERRHARVVPTLHMAFIDQLLEPALAGDGVVQVEPGELVLTRLARHRQVVEKPLVKRAMILELQGADRVGNALDGVRLTMGEVIAGVDAPLVAGLMVMGMANAVENRIAQVHVRRGHVDFRAQGTSAIGEFAGLHAGEQLQVLRHRTLTERAVLARLGQIAAVLPRLIGRQVADIGLAGLDQFDGPVMQLVEVVGGVALLAGPLEAQPLHVALDRVDVFLVFLGRVGVVEAQVALAAEFLGQAEVQADRLGMADMQVAVGLRREAGDDLRVLAGVQIGLDDGTKEVRSGDNLWLAHGVLDHADARHREADKTKRLS